ncbi:MULTISPECIES: hypothetical protein [Synechococcales]|uniref:hypothetical protein n=1 Tax=Synechococcus sp. CS-1324 TaxID=2847980 RepID=UPI00223C102E|nr:hypothetical protein [Synechococcus sp. CS-1324]
MHGRRPLSWRSQGPAGWWFRLALAFSLAVSLLVGAAPLLASPVSWKEVAASAEGRQWWDEGSLRRSRDGYLSVLSRYKPADTSQAGELYVMEVDCLQQRFRDTSVNGLPRFRAAWQPADGDSLIRAVLQEACAAGLPLLASG